jgi:hypothetical protein
MQKERARGRSSEERKNGEKREREFSSRAPFFFSTALSTFFFLLPREKTKTLSLSFPPPSALLSLSSPSRRERTRTRGTRIPCSVRGDPTLEEEEEEQGTATTTAAPRWAKRRRRRRRRAFLLLRVLLLPCPTSRACSPRRLPSSPCEAPNDLFPSPTCGKERDRGPREAQSSNGEFETTDAIFFFSFFFGNKKKNATRSAGEAAAFQDLSLSPPTPSHTHPQPQPTTGRRSTSGRPSAWRCRSRSVAARER